MTSRKEIFIKQDTNLKRNLKHKRILTTLVLETENWEFTNQAYLHHTYFTYEYIHSI